MLEKWRKLTRAHEHDHFLHVLDFLRHYFVHACEPVQKIQKCACKQTGKKGKDDTFKDLPESLVDSLLTELDALNLTDKELLESSSEYERTPNKWWLELAENNEARKRMYSELSEAQMTWSARIRTAMGRALTDVLVYHFDPDRAALLASKKKRIMTFTANMGLDFIERTEFADIAVETDVNDTY